MRPIVVLRCTIPILLYAFAILVPLHAEEPGIPVEISPAPRVTDPPPRSPILLPAFEGGDWSETGTSGAKKRAPAAGIVYTNLLRYRPFVSSTTFWHRFYTNQNGTASAELDPAIEAEYFAGGTVVNRTVLDLDRRTDIVAEALMSGEVIVPANITDIYVDYRYTFTHGGNCSDDRSYVTVYIADTDSQRYLGVKRYYTSVEPSDSINEGTAYRTVAYRYATPSNVAGKRVRLLYQLVNPDPETCSLSFRVGEPAFAVEQETGYFSYDGVAYYVSIPPYAAGKQAVYRFSRLDGYGHFYTASEDEKAFVETRYGSRFVYDGIAYYVDTAPSGSSLPVYRFSRTDGFGHFYTASEDEKAIIQQSLAGSFGYDGVAYYVQAPPYPDRLVPVYRSSRLDGFGHFYTASAVENASVNPGWQP